MSKSMVYVVYREPFSNPTPGTLEPLKAFFDFDRAMAHANELHNALPANEAARWAYGVESVPTSEVSK